jgi:hypothetical protein
LDFSSLCQIAVKCVTNKRIKEYQGSGEFALAARLVQEHLRETHELAKALHGQTACKAPGFEVLQKSGCYGS